MPPSTPFPRIAATAAPAATAVTPRGAAPQPGPPARTTAVILRARNPGSPATSCAASELPVTIAESAAVAAGIPAGWVTDRA